MSRQELSPEMIAFYDATAAINRIVETVDDEATRYETLLGVRKYLEARIEQNKPTEGDWLDG